MVAKDKELFAISSIIQLLLPLDVTGRSRVLEYVLKRLDMSAFDTSPLPIDDRNANSQSVSYSIKPDIRSLTVEKQPKSANEMVALIAYYLSELASTEDASNTVNVELIRKYFKMAGFPMPRVPKSALTNAAAAGYLENVSRGEYKLNPVGYNLVVHALPRSANSTQKTGRAALKKSKGKR